MKNFKLLLIIAWCCILASCNTQNGEQSEEQRPLVEINTDPYPSTYRPQQAPPTLITNVTAFDGNGQQLNKVSILMQDGDIKAIGKNIATDTDTVVIDGKGKWLTPGIIDVHSHMGVYASIATHSHSDGNEVTGPNTAGVWAEHGVWPQDPSFTRALAGGITSIQVLPGSANLFGGRSVILKMAPSRTVQGMKFPNAPYGMKMACGENPKRVYGDKGGPYSRMGNFAGYRKGWIDAKEYLQKWEDYQEKHAKGEDPDPPKQNIKLDTLAGVLKGEINVHMHCYRADEMVNMMVLMKEFDYQITSFQHAVEAYKIGDLLAENNVCAAMWADWWGFKMEAYDGVRENIPLVHKAEACAIVHSDSEAGIQHLNQEAAKALADGNRAGLNISKAESWRWLSSNPAKSLGIFDQTGSLEIGKDADIVLWDGDPFSVYTRPEQVYVDGAKLYDASKGYEWVTDFELGQPGEGDIK